jgi:hypothetical protein
MKRRLIAAIYHLTFSGLVAAAAAFLVFYIWYPSPFESISGGFQLFFLVCVVDVIVGPLLTFVIFNIEKNKRELIVDLTVVALLQLVALIYGLSTIFNARPVHVVFEYDRFRVVHAFEIETEGVDELNGVVLRPLNGPQLLALRPFKDEKERLDATLAAIQGISLASRPELWIKYEASADAVLKAARPLENLKLRNQDEEAVIEAFFDKSHLDKKIISYVPLIGRQKYWTVLLRRDTGEIVGYIPIDSF